MMTPMGLVRPVDQNAPLDPPSLPSTLSRRSGLSVAEMMSMRDRGGIHVSSATDPRTGRRLGSGESVSLGPMFNAGFDTGQGGRRGGGGFGGSSYGGGMRPRSQVNSSGVAGGIPTSQRGRADLAIKRNPILGQSEAGLNQAWMDAEKPAWAQPYVGLPPRAPSVAPPMGMPNAASDMGTKPVAPSAMPTAATLDPFNNPSGLYAKPIAGFAQGIKDSGPKPQVAVVGEQGPELTIVPAHSQIVPNQQLPPFMRVQSTALDQLVGGQPEGPYDGQMQRDSSGNMWRYDAKTKRGIPMNPYLGDPNAPSPDAFQSTASERYNDLSMRLNAIRQAGMASARGRVAEMQQNEASLDAEARRKSRLDPNERRRIDVPAEQGGGQMVRGKYGTAIIGGNRPKSFTVERLDGTDGKYTTVQDADTESRADAAQRRVEGKPVVAVNRPQPIVSAFEEVVEPTIAPPAVQSPAKAAQISPEIQKQLDEVTRLEQELQKKWAPKRGGRMGMLPTPRLPTPQEVKAAEAANGPVGGIVQQLLPKLLQMPNALVNLLSGG